MGMWVVAHGLPVVSEVSLGLGGCCSSCFVSLVISLRDDGVVGLMIATENNSYSFGEMEVF